MINRERMLKEFLEMVRIDSVSGHEREMADYIMAKLKQMNLEFFEDDTGKKINTGTGNVIARVPGAARGGTPVLLSAHMDTVEPGRGIVPVVRDGVVRSSGDTVLGGDNKAGIAIILEALRVIAEDGIQHAGLDIAFDVYEEGGLLGAKNFNPDRITARIGYVLDSDKPPGTIINRAPSHDRINVTINGRAAHAGICPEKGINAIEVAARAISEIRQGRIDEHTTVNIGLISGGKATNIVPDSVFIQAETRSLDESKKDLQTKIISEKMKEWAAAFGAGADVQVRNLYRSFALGEDEKVVRIAVEAAKNIGLEPKLDSTGGGSDANSFNELGIQTVVLGIAMQNVHTTEEFIKIEDMAKTCGYILEIVKVAAQS